MEKSFRYDKDTAVVQTKQGAVHGYEYDGVTVFKGIPYAKAKRFHAPEPADPWEPVKALQAAFDPGTLVFSREYYEVLGLPER